MRLLHVIETTPNPEGQCVNAPRLSKVAFSCVYPNSDMCSLTISGLLPPRLPISRSIVCVTFSDTARKRSAYIRIPANWRRPAVLHAFSHRRKRYPGTQVSHLIPLHQLYRYTPRHRIRQRNRHPSMERPRCGEALSVPARYTRSQDILDQLQRRIDAHGGQLCARHSTHIQIGV